MNEVSDWIRGQVLGTKNDDLHPLIGFTGLLDPSETLNGIDVRRARLTTPDSVACKDDGFVKLFYNWERTHVYQLNLSKEMAQVVSENVEALNLARFSGRNTVRHRPEYPR